MVAAGAPSCQQWMLSVSNLPSSDDGDDACSHPADC